eukprot:1823781-Prymnesium_polylepis.2
MRAPIPSPSAISAGAQADERAAPASRAFSLDGRPAPKFFSLRPFPGTFHTVNFRRNIDRRSATHPVTVTFVCARERESFAASRLETRKTQVRVRDTKILAWKGRARKPIVKPVKLPS